MSKTELKQDEKLWNGERLMSPNGRYNAIFKDGNFAIYELKQTWASNTWKGDHVVMQNGDLVIYQGTNYADYCRYWRAHHGGGSANCHARLTDDGNIVIAEGNGQELWTSARSTGIKEQECDSMGCWNKT